MSKFIRKLLQPIFIWFLKKPFMKNGVEFYLPSSTRMNSNIDEKAKIYFPYQLNSISVGAYSYISKNSDISFAEIGKFCSIGPNFFCGWGIHPLNGISTSPMFYSKRKQNGVTLSKEDKIEERKKIIIGNDVFIGANVTVLDDITIGDGAIIGAGSLVTKNIPPYSIAYGIPIKIVKKRFDDDTIDKLLKIEWWNKPALLTEIEERFFQVEEFISIYCNDERE